MCLPCASGHDERPARGRPRSTTLSSPCRFCSSTVMHDKFVPVEADQRMAEVWHPSHHTLKSPLHSPGGLRSVLQPQGHQTLD